MASTASTSATITLDDLRRFAVGHTLFRPTRLAKAIERLGFVQADPIRAPARAQDLILRHRVSDYRAGDLEAKYGRLNVEEDFFINHGFVPRDVHTLMHPRVYNKGRWGLIKKYSASVLAYVRDHGIVHPRDVDAKFAHGSMRNGWGGQSSVTTQLLDGMHYRGMLRIAGRDKGIRLYALPAITHATRTRHEVDDALDRLLDVLINQYAPLPSTSITTLLGRVRFGAPQWASRLRLAIARARKRWAHTTIDGVTWYWPPDVTLSAVHHAPDDELRLLAPFDPIVWDRKRLEQFWGWAYRFEAYTPAAKRKLGYYALPMLWRDHVIGWANVNATDRGVEKSFGYVAGRAPRDSMFKRALEAECQRMDAFLGYVPA